MGSILASLAALLALALLVTSRFVIVFSDPRLAAHLPTGIVLFAIAFGFLFYILLGIKNLLLRHRRQWQYVLYLCLFYFGFSIFFSAGPGIPFLARSIILFIGSALLLREFFKFQEHGHQRLITTSAWLLAFLVTQCAWALSLLPFRFSAAASLMIVIVYSLSEITSRYLHGNLTARFLRINSFIFLGFFLLIFFTTHWKL